MNVDQLPNAFSEGEGTLPLTQDEITWQDQELKDLAALKLVIQNFNRSVNFVKQRGIHETWNNADDLWRAQVKSKPWPNGVPRSAIGIPLVREHVTTLRDQIIQTFFADPQPFVVDPRPGTSADVARANEALLVWELDQTKFRQRFEVFVQDMLLYGTAIAKWGWQSYTRKIRKYRRKAAPEVLNAGPAGTVQIHSPEYDQAEPYDVEQTINAPFFENRNASWVLVDPQLRTTDVRDGEFVIDVIYEGLDWVDQLREYEGFTIPSRDELEKLITPDKTEGTAVNPLESQNVGGSRYLPDPINHKALPRWDDGSIDPTKKKFQILEYWTNDQVITVLQQKLVIRNDRNVHGVIPFVSAVFDANPDAFYGSGVADLIGGEQRGQAGVRNAAIDIEALRLSGGGVKKAGSGISSQEVTISPGRWDNVEDVNQYKPYEFESMLGTAAAYMAASDALAQRRTGAQQTSVQGQQPVQGSNLFRTTAGVQMMTGGAGNRLQAHIERLANQVFIPTIEAFNMMNPENLLPSQYQQILSDEMDAAFTGDPFDIMNGAYKFRVLAGARMQARKAAVNLPFMMQFFADPNTQQHLAAQDMTFDFMEWIKMASDQQELPNRQSLIRKMTDDEKAAYQQAQQAEAQASQAQQQQKVQLETAAKSQLISQKNEEKLALDRFESEFDQQKVGHDLERKALEAEEAR